MNKILVIFASKSDSLAYALILNLLKKNKIEFDFRIYSAHKTPYEVENVIKNSYSVIIAGAGLAAHLPGVIASKTLSPVIGVPCKGNYEGLDALLSIAQMPPGIPVLAVGVNQSEIAANNAIKMLKKYEIVTIIGDKSNASLNEATNILKKFQVNYKFSTAPNAKSINIEFTYFDEKIEAKDELVIYCPLLLEKDDKASAALNLLKHASHGLWVGINNGTNAALAAIEIMNIDNEHEEKLIAYRREIGKKVLEGNKKS